MHYVTLVYIGFKSVLYAFPNRIKSLTLPLSLYLIKNFEDLQYDIIFNEDL